MNKLCRNSIRAIEIELGKQMTDFNSVTLFANDKNSKKDYSCIFNAFSNGFVLDNKFCDVDKITSKFNYLKTLGFRFYKSTITGANGNKRLIIEIRR